MDIDISMYPVKCQCQCHINDHSARKLLFHGHVKQQHQNKPVLNSITKPGNKAKHRVVLQHVRKFISNFQVHVGAATNCSVIPWDGVAFRAMQFSREELLTNIADV